MISKQKLYSISVASISIILMLVSIASAESFANTKNHYSNNTAVIDTAINTTTATMNIGNTPFGVAVTPDGTKV